MARRRIARPEGLAALRRCLAASEGGAQASSGGTPGAEAGQHAQGSPRADRPTRATAVRFLLEELAAQAPGNSVEVRVPPFGVTQCAEGPRHTRGTPPNVIEISAEVWLELATGRTSWADATQRGEISASGIRADLHELLPLVSAEDLRTAEHGDA
jgi:hypothetical protein